MMPHLPLESMSVEDKIAMMETLWNDLCRHQDVEPPLWHQDILNQRHKHRQQGNEIMMNWNDVKQRLLKQT